MRPEHTMQLARELLNQHGLLMWNLRWTKQGTFRMLGSCRPRRQVISLNREWCSKAPDHEVKDLILHEIAHALDWVRYGKAGHGPTWKRICVEIGADPSRLYEGETILESNRSARYVLRHKETKQTYKEYYKYPHKAMRVISNMWIRGRKVETYGKLEIVSLR